jgi:hypothetical protein
MDLLRKPVTIVVVVAIASSAALFVANHTNLLPSRLPTAPPGTTFNTVQDAGAAVTPSHAESPLKPKQAGPPPARPPNPTRSPG